MGQARRKALLKIPSEPLRLDHVESVASAIRRLAVAASDRLGADCFVLSALAQALRQSIGEKEGSSCYRGDEIK